MIYFSERQRFTQWWIWVLAAIAPLATLVMLAVGIEEIQQDMTTWVIMVILLCGFVPLLLFFFLRLDTSIADDGVRYRFAPLHVRERFIPWSEIGRAYVRKYRPIAEYGGWGIKGGFGHGLAYNVKGNMGLQLELTNGKKILLGTQKVNEIEAVLRQLGHS